VSAAEERILGRRADGFFREVSMADAQAKVSGSHQTQAAEGAAEGQRQPDQHDQAQSGVEQGESTGQSSKQKQVARRERREAHRQQKKAVERLASRVQSTPAHAAAVADMLAADESPTAAMRCVDIWWNDKTLLVVTNRRILWAKKSSLIMAQGEIDANSLREVSRTGARVVFQQTGRWKTVFRAWREEQIPAVVRAAQSLIDLHHG
jgi:hypothetical protein